MHISKQSLIYQFQLKALCASNGSERHPDIWIPDNLCPYMRRFTRLLLATIGIFSFIAICIIAMLYTLAVALFIIPWDLFPVLLGMGGALWLVAFIAGLHFWYTSYGKNSPGYQNFLRKTKHMAHKAWYPIASRINCNIFVRWYRAIHDHLCPKLTFYRD